MSWDMNKQLGLHEHEESNFLHAQWPAPKQVHTLITTRLGGFSQGNYAGLNIASHVGDCSDDVSRNRLVVQKHVRYPIVYLHQTHTTTVVSARDAYQAAQQGTISNADGSIAWRGDQVACAVMTADCLPILLCDQEGESVAAVHAGWRGLAGGIVENAVKKMNISATRLLAYLGPAIGPDAFEVGLDVYNDFCSHYEQAEQAFHPIDNQKYLANIYLLATMILAKVGVHQVFGGNYCTVLERNYFYSYRRDGDTGRMASIIWLDDEQPN